MGSLLHGVFSVCSSAAVQFPLEKEAREIPVDFQGVSNKVFFCTLRGFAWRINASYEFVVLFLFNLWRVA